MKPQTYANHRRFLPLFHGYLLLFVIAIIVGSMVNLCKALEYHSGIYSASLIAALSFAFVCSLFFQRGFAIKAQDRAIRAEENLRHFALTGKLLDPRITMSQVVALRFAPDEEFVALAKTAAETGMKNNDIKKSITSWKADHHRA